MYLWVSHVFYSIYLVDDLVEIHNLNQELAATTQKGRLISTQKNYQDAWEAALALAREKKLPLVDRTKVSGAGEQP